MANYRILNLDQVTSKPSDARIALRDQGIMTTDGIMVSVSGWKLKQICPWVKCDDEILVRI